VPEVRDGAHALDLATPLTRARSAEPVAGARESARESTDRTSFRRAA
jgi:hypothetical protein